MKTETERRRELEVLTDAQVDEAYTLAKGSFSQFDFVGRLVSGITREKIDYIIENEKNNGRISG